VGGVDRVAADRPRQVVVDHSLKHGVHLDDEGSVVFLPQQTKVEVLRHTKIEHSIRDLAMDRGAKIICGHGGPIADGPSAHYARRPRRDADASPTTNDEVPHRLSLSTPGARSCPRQGARLALDTMTESRKARTLRDDAAAVAQRLGRNAARALVQVHDPDLRRVLTYVSTRRHARATPEGVPVHEADVGLSASASGSAPSLLDESGMRPSGAPGTLLDIRRVSEDVRILRVVRPEGFGFEPGQYVKLAVPGGERNPYTIASAPGEPYLEFCVEQAPGGRVSPRLFALRPGDRVLLDAKAKGNFTLVASAHIHLMVATVTGIAPFRSMLRHAERRDAWPGKFIVLHGASFADELAYRSELETLAERFAGRVRYLPSVSRPADPRNRTFAGDTGRVSELVVNAIGELGRTTAGLQVYACGNPDMVATVRRQMESLGVPVATEVFA
jgi:ferredoxin-NADP reductase